MRTVTKRLRFLLECVGSVTSNALNVLDIGVGHGVYIEQIVQLQKARCYVGVDIIKPHLLTIRSTDTRDGSKGPHLFLAAAEALPFDENVFDVILLIEVFEHINDDVTALKEMHRVLKPGGLLVLTAPNKLFPFETHGARIGKRQVSTANLTNGLGVPLLPLLPELIRAHTTNARVYTLTKLKQVLAQEGFVLEKIDFLGPNLEAFADNLSSETSKELVNYLIKFFSRLEKDPIIKHFMATFIVCCLNAA